jgi:hypothetical protein
MTTPSNDPGRYVPRSDERTRNIRLPSSPDRPPAAVRPEWQTHVPQPAEAPPTELPGDVGTPATAALLNRSPEQVPPRPYVLPDDPTDKLSSPPQVRQQTLAFDSPPAGVPAPVPPPPGRPAPLRGADVAPPAASPVQGAPTYVPPGPAPERSRRWPWVVLTVLPILVIVGAGLMLLLLLRGG